MNHENNLNYLSSFFCNHYSNQFEINFEHIDLTL